MLDANEVVDILNNSSNQARVLIRTNDNWKASQVQQNMLEERRPHSFVAELDERDQPTEPAKAIDYGQDILRSGDFTCLVHLANRVKLQNPERP